MTNGRGTMTLRRTDPFDLAVGHVLNQFFNDPFICGPTSQNRVDEGSLALDVSETDTEVIVRASLPGFRKEDVSIDVAEGVLTIKAEQAEEREEQNERFYRRERRFGSLSRRVALPTHVSESSATAQLTDGVLTLRLPKSEKAMPRKISIN